MPKLNQIVWSPKVKYKFWRWYVRNHTVGCLQCASLQVIVIRVRKYFFFILLTSEYFLCNLFLGEETGEYCYLDGKQDTTQCIFASTVHVYPMFKLCAHICIVTSTLGHGGKGRRGQDYYRSDPLHQIIYCSLFFLWAGK